MSTSHVVTQKYKYVAGVDTHSKTHHLTLINNLGAVVGKREIRVLPNHMEKAIDWVITKTQGNVLFAVEGTSSYGETLVIALQRRNIAVCEVKAPKTKTRGQKGKTDEIDSLIAAQSILTKPINKLIRPKTQGMIKVLRILLTARRGMSAQSVMDKNALVALLRTNNLGIHITSVLNPTEIKKIANWRISFETGENVEISI